MGILSNARAAGAGSEDDDFLEGEFVELVAASDDNGNTMGGDQLAHELVVLRECLRSFDWSKTDPVAWTIIESQIHLALQLGHGDEVRRLCAEHAPVGDARLEALLGPQDGDVLQAQIIEDVAGPATGTALVAPFVMTYEPHIPSGKIEPQASDAPANDQNASSAKGGEADLNKSSDKQGNPTSEVGGTLAALIGAPFALTAASGSLVINAIKRTGGLVKSRYNAAVIDGHALMGTQLEVSAAKISTIAAGLKSEGMRELMEQMRMFGSASEIAKVMGPGQTFSAFGEHFDSLMDKPLFADHYRNLNRAMREFSVLAHAYARVGVDKNLDYSEKLESSLAAVAKATEGVVVKHGNTFKHLQDNVRSLGERVIEMVRKLLGRLVPSPA